MNNHICSECNLNKTTYWVWDNNIFNCGNLCWKCDWESRKDDLNCFNIECENYVNKIKTSD